MGMFNFKEGEMNEKDEDIIGRVLNYLESAEVYKNIKKKYLLPIKHFTFSLSFNSHNIFSWL